MTTWRWLVCMAMVCSHATAQEVSGTRPACIEVQAQAVIEAQPDTAIVELGVATRAESAAAAVQRNARRMQAVLSVVKQAMGERAKIGTGTYSLRTEHSSTRDGGASKVVGYVASNVVLLDTQELSRVGEIIDAAIQAGANHVQRISFGLDDPSDVRRQALRNAVMGAKADAEAIASTLQVEVGPVLSVTQQDAGPIRPFMQEGMAARSAPAPTPIEPGTIPVRAGVTLRMQVVN